MHARICKQERKFRQTLINKTCTKKILQHLGSNFECDGEDKHDCDNYEINNRDDLQHKIDNSLPILFILTHSNLCLFHKRMIRIYNSTFMSMLFLRLVGFTSNLALWRLGVIRS